MPNLDQLRSRNTRDKSRNCSPSKSAFETALERPQVKNILIDGLLLSQNLTEEWWQDVASVSTFSLSARNTSGSLPIQSYTMKQWDIVWQPRTSATCRSQKHMPRRLKLQKNLRTESVSMFSIVCVNILYASSLCCGRSVTCEGLS